MAGSDNTLGAPTEGLGQKVTFAFNPGSSTPQLQLSERGGVRAGVRGGGTVNAGGTLTRAQDLGPPNPTFGLLMKVGQKLLEPQMKARQVEGYVRGMQRAMQGEAVADIAKEQPWYSTLFGDSDVVEGARAYAGQAKAQTAMAALEENMQELRTLSPDQAQDRFISTVNEHLTGDNPTDASILSAMTRAMPAVMRRQAKEHYGWQQENATVQEAAAFKAGATNLQAAAKGLKEGTYTEEEFNTLRDDFVRSVVPAVGRDEENYKESMRDNLVGWAANGNFHALNALRDKGFFSVLDSAAAAKVEAATARGEANLRTKYTLDWGDQLVEINSMVADPAPGTTPAQVAERIDKLNAAYEIETGSRGGLITPEQRVAMLTRNVSEIKQEQARAAARAVAQAQKLRQDGDKAQAKYLEDEMIRQRAAAGTLGTLTTNPDMGPTKVNAVVEPMYQRIRAQDPVKADRFLVQNMREDYVIEPVKRVREGQVNDALAAGQYTPEFETVVNDYKRLASMSEATADAYYGKHAAAMAGYTRDVQLGATELGAFQEHFVNGGRTARLSSEEMTQSVKAIDKEFGGGWAGSWLGGQEFAPGQARRLASMLADPIKKFVGATDDVPNSVKRAVNSAKAAGKVEILGGYAWASHPGQTSLEKYLTSTVGPKAEGPIATDKVNTVFAEAVKEVLYGDGDTSGTLHEQATETFIERLPDVGGVPQFLIQSNVDGVMHTATLSGKDLYTKAAKRKERQKDTTFGIKNESLKFGPDNRFLPKEGAPSIYGR